MKPTIKTSKCYKLLSVSYRLEVIQNSKRWEVFIRCVQLAALFLKLDIVAPDGYSAFWQVSYNKYLADTR
jgi:hypothetical protein